MDDEPQLCEMCSDEPALEQVESRDDSVGYHETLWLGPQCLTKAIWNEQRN